MREQRPLLFKPWKAENYHKSDCPILIVGESHYSKEKNLTRDELEHLTINLLDSFTIGKWHHRFFTGISRVLSGKTAMDTRPIRQEIWDNAAFYNYIQGFVGEEPRCGYSKKSVSESKDAFAKVIDDLKPDIILIFSKRLWWDMYCGGNPLIASEEASIDGLKNPVRYCRGATAISFPHPSGRGFDAIKQHDAWQHALSHFDIQSIRRNGRGRGT